MRIVASYMEFQLHTCSEHLSLPPCPLITTSRGKAVNPCPGSINLSLIVHTRSIQVANRGAAPKFNTKELSRATQRRSQQGLDPWGHLTEKACLWVPAIPVSCWPRQEGAAGKKRSVWGSHAGSCCETHCPNAIISISWLKLQNSFCLNERWPSSNPRKKANA